MFHLSARTFSGEVLDQLNSFKCYKLCCHCMNILQINVILNKLSPDAHFSLRHNNSFFYYLSQTHELRVVTSLFLLRRIKT